MSWPCHLRPLFDCRRKSVFFFKLRGSLTLGAGKKSAELHKVTNTVDREKVAAELIWLIMKHLYTSEMFGGFWHHQQKMNASVAMFSIKRESIKRNKWGFCCGLLAIVRLIMVILSLSFCPLLKKYRDIELFDVFKGHFQVNIFVCLVLLVLSFKKA